MQTVTFPVIWYVQRYPFGFPSFVNPPGLATVPPASDLSDLAGWAENANLVIDVSTVPYQGLASVEGVEGTVTFDLDWVFDASPPVFNAANGDTFATTIFIKHPTKNVAMACSIFWGSTSPRGSEFNSALGNVADGNVGFRVGDGKFAAIGNAIGGSKPGQPRTHVKWELLRGGIPFLTYEGASEDIELLSPRFPVRPTSSSAPPGPTLAASMFRQYYRTTPATATNDGLMNFALPLYDSAFTEMRVTLTYGAYTWSDNYPVPLPPVPIIALLQDGEEINDGLWDLTTEVTAAGGASFPTTGLVRARTFRLKDTYFPDVMTGTVELDASRSYSPSNPATASVKWQQVSPVSTSDFVMLNAPVGFYYNDTAPHTTATDFSTGGSLTRYGLILKGADNYGVSFWLGVHVDSNFGGPVALRTGEALWPFDTGTGTEIRLVNDAMPTSLVSTLPAREVTLMRHETAIYAASASGRTLQNSLNEGKTWSNPLTTNIPNIGRIIDWCELEHGGFAAIGWGNAPNRNKLYGSVSWDSVTWAAATLQRDGGTVAPRGKVTQMSASGESHLIVSDGKTYVIRVDDFFATENPNAAADL